jgi:predicted transcriptional regulator
MEFTITLPEDLYSEIEALAREENKTTIDVIRSAVRRVTERERWQDLFAYGYERAKSLGIGESDIERLITDSRQEQR